MSGFLEKTLLTANIYRSLTEFTSTEPSDFNTIPIERAKHGIVQQNLYAMLDCARRINA